MANGQISLEREPPPLPVRKNARAATALNIFLPGAGLIYLGRKTVGWAMMVSFLICLLAALGIFLVGYARYFQLALGGHILEGDRIEQIGGLFHTPWLVGLAIAGGAIHVASMIVLAQETRRLKLEAPKSGEAKE